MEWQSNMLPVNPSTGSNGVAMMNSGGFYAQDPLKTEFSDFYGASGGAGGGGGGGSYMSNRGTEYAATQHVPETNGSYLLGGGGGMGGYYSEEAYPSYFEYPQYAPCEGGPGPWNFNYCYGFFGEAPCPYANVIDMEDFM